MTTSREGVICPICGSELEDGFLSYGSGTVWHGEKPKGLGRFFLSAYSTGERVFGSIASYPYVFSVPGARCSECHTVLIPGARPS